MDITILLEEFCDENGYTFYPDYSGRGMYGSTCLGIGHVDMESSISTRRPASTGVRMRFWLPAALSR